MFFHLFARPYGNLSTIPTKKKRRRGQRLTPRKARLALEPLEDRAVPAVAPFIQSVIPVDGSSLTSAHPTLAITFSEEMQFDNNADTGVADPDNYLLFDSAGNKITIDDITAANAASQTTVTLAYNGGEDLIVDSYSLFVHGDKVFDVNDNLPLARPGQLVVANGGSNDISVVDLIGDGTIGALSNYPVTGGNPNAVAFGEVSGDTLPDLIIADSATHTVSIYQGRVGGGFDLTPTLKLNLPTGATNQAKAIVVQDFNADTKLDIAVANENTNNVSIFLNEQLSAGNIGFAPAVNYAVGARPLDMVSADLDGDAKPDLAIVNRTASTDLNSDSINDYRVTVLFGSNDGTFGSAKTVRIGDANNRDFSEPTGLAVGLLDGDSKPDLAVSGRKGLLVMINGSIAGSANFTQTIITTSATTSVAIGKADSDTMLDLVATTDENGGEVLVVRNLGGAPTIFLPPSRLAAGSNPRDVTLQDLNGDNRTDILFVNHTAPGRLGVLLNTGAVVNGLITGATNTNPIKITSASHGLTTGDRVTITGVEGNTAANGIFNISNVLTSTTGTITNATNATPIVITSANHGLTTGQRVSISGVTGNTAANGIFFINMIDADTFSLVGSTGNGAYVSGGTWALIDENTFTLDGSAGNGAYVRGGSWSIGARIFNATNDDPIVINSPKHGLQTGDAVTVSGVLGNTAANGTYAVTVIDVDNFSLDGTEGNGRYTTGSYWQVGAFISSATNTSPITITSPSHNLITGDTVFISGVQGNTAANGRFTVNNTFVTSKITGATNASPIVITSTGHGLTTGDRVTVSGVQGNTAANGVFNVTVVNADSFQLNGSTGNGNYTTNATFGRSGAITGATNASPIVITSTNHGLATGTIVDIAGVGGNTNANGTFTVTVVDANSFSLNGTTGSGNYTSGGSWSIGGNITDATNGSPVVITSAGHGLATGTKVDISGIIGNTSANGTFTVTVLDANTFSLDGSSGNGEFENGGRWTVTDSVTFVSNTNPVVITSPKHGLTAGDRVMVENVTGNTAANGTFTVTNVFTGAITAATNAGPIVVTSADHGLTAGQQVTITGVVGNTAANGTFTISNVLTATTGTITNATNATPIVITDNGHGLTTGQRVSISGVAGNTAANGTFFVKVIDANTFSLFGSKGNGAYTSGGTWTLIDETKFSLNGTTGNGAYVSGGTWTAADPDRFKLVGATGNAVYDGGGKWSLVNNNTFTLANSSGNGNYTTNASFGRSGTITGATNANPIVITSANHGLTTGTRVTISGVGGNTNANGTFTITVVDANQFRLNGASGNANYTSGGTWSIGGTISDASNASPIVITSVNHGLATGTTVNVTGVLGNTNANGSFTITRIDNDRFSLNNSTPNGLFANGGRWSIGNAITDATNTSPISVTSADHALTTGDPVRVSDVTGNTAANGNFFVTSTGTNTFTLDSSAGNGDYGGGGAWRIGGEITNATNASPIIITSTNYGLADGTRVTVEGTLGNTAANGSFNISAIDANTFSLNGSTGNGAYDNGGKWSQAAFLAASGSPFGVDSFPVALALADTNQDGHLDVVTVNVTSRSSAITGATNAGPIVITSVSHGLATGTRVSISGVGGNTAANGTFTITRIDNDRFSLDSSTGNANYTSGGTWTVSRASGTFSLLAGKGTGAFRVSRNTDLTPEATRAVAVGDVDMDGLPDLVVVNNATSSADSFVSILTGNVDGTYDAPVDFSPVVTGATFRDYVSVAIGDINNDSKPDIVIAGRQDKEVGFLRNDITAPGATLAFTAIAEVVVGDNPSQVVLADFNNDGKLDLAVAHDRTGGLPDDIRRGVTIRLGNGNFTFQTIQEVASGTAASALAVADFNRDGFLDFVVADDQTNGRVKLFFGDGTGAFANRGTFDLGIANPGSLAVADFNRDGFLDVVAASKATAATTGGVAVLLSQLGTGFSAPLRTEVFPGTGLQSVLVTDVNVDAFPDLVVSTIPGTGGLIVDNVFTLPGRGDGSFGSPVPYLAGKVGAPTPAPSYVAVVPPPLLRVTTFRSGGQRVRIDAVRNGRFEARDLAGEQGSLLGWQTSSLATNPGSYGRWALQTGRLSPLSQTTVPAPQGTYAAALDQHHLVPFLPGQTNPNTAADYAGSHALYQDIFIPANAKFGRSGTITGATNANPIVITSANHGLATGTRVTITGIGGNTNANGIFTITVLGTDTFRLNGAAGNGTYTGGGTWSIGGAITDATNANPGPIVITSAGHGLTTGTLVDISGILGNTAANGSFTVTVIDPDKFSLNGSTGNGAYANKNVTATLSFRMYIDNSGSSLGFNPSIPGSGGDYSETNGGTLALDFRNSLQENQQVRVDFVVPQTDPLGVGASTVLKNFFITAPGQQKVQTVIVKDVDVSQFAGQTVRLRFAATNNRGKLVVVVDDVKVGVVFEDSTDPTLSNLRLRNPGTLINGAFHTTDHTLLGVGADNGSISNLYYIEFDPNNNGFGGTDDFKSVTFDALGNFSFTPLVPLSQGLHNVGVRLVDQAGNDVTGSIAVFAQGDAPSEWRATGSGRIDVSNLVDASGNPLVNYRSVSGRITDIVVDPRDSSGNTYYVGSANGGVWKTIDGGNAWRPLMDAVTDASGNVLPAPIGALALVPSSPDIIYAGTGVADSALDSRPGLGILKSTDGGASWTIVGDSSTVLAGARISKIVIAPEDPNNPNDFEVVYVGVASGGQQGPGVYRSKDGGQTWVNIVRPQSMFTDPPNNTTLGAGTQLASVTDMVLDPFNPKRLLIGLGNIGLVSSSASAGVWLAVDASINVSASSSVPWARQNGGANGVLNSTLPSGTNVGRVTLAMGTGRIGDEDTVYVMMGTPSGNNTPPNFAYGGFLGLYKSSNNMLNFTKVQLKEEIGSTFTNISLLGREASNVGALQVDPANPNIVYVGGSNRLLQTSSASNLIRVAQNLDGEGWNTSSNANITDDGGTNTSTTIPHVSVQGTGDDSFDYYSFTVSQAGVRGIFDIDAENFDTQLFLYDSTGTLLDENDDNFGDPGDGPTGFASLIDYTFTAPGTYIIGVGAFFSFDDNGEIDGDRPLPGDVYTLHVSVANHPTNAAGNNSVAEIEPNHPTPTHAFVRVDTGNMRDATYDDPFDGVINDGDDRTKTGEGVFWFDLEQNQSNRGGTQKRLPSAIHALSFDQQGRLLIGTEGGIWRGTNLGFGYDFTSGGTGFISTRPPASAGMRLQDLNGNLQIAGLTSVAVDPVTANRFYTSQLGTGTSVFDGVSWKSAGLTGPTINGVNLGIPNAGAIEVAVPSTPGDPAVIYRVWQYLDQRAIQPERSLDGGLTFGAMGISGLNTNNSTASVFPAFGINPDKFDSGNGLESDELLLGTSTVFLTRSNVFDPIVPGPSTGGSKITAIAFAPPPADDPLTPEDESDQRGAYYVGTESGQVFFTSNTGGDNWPLRDTGLPDVPVEYLAVDPFDQETAYAVFGVTPSGTGHLFRTTDAGVTWTNISANLPDVPMYSLVIDPRPMFGAAGGKLYVATNVGVYVSTNDGTSWNRASVALPSAPVVDLEHNASSEVLAAATQGRGAFFISTAPMSEIPDQVINEDTSTGPLQFSLNDLGVPGVTFTVTATSDNQTLVPNANIVLGGSGNNRTINIFPAANLFGAANITVTVTDGSITRTQEFKVTVNSVNDLPAVTVPGNQSAVKALTATTIGPLTITFSDVETDADDLVVVATSDNQALIPNANIVIGSFVPTASGGSKTITLTTTANTGGTARISVQVTDLNGGTTTKTFDVVIFDNTALPVFDDFNRGDNTFLNSYWDETGGDFRIETTNGVAATGLVRGDAAGGNYAIIRGIFATEVKVAADVDLSSSGANAAGLVARHAGGANGDMYLGELIRINGTVTARIWSRRSGGWTLLGSGTTASSAGTLRFEVVKSSLKLFLNNSLIAYGHDTAAAPLAAGSVGIYSNGAGATLDNFDASAITLVGSNLNTPFDEPFPVVAADNAQLDRDWVETAGNFKVLAGATVQPNNTASYAIVNGINQSEVSVSALVNLPASGTHSVGLVARHAGGPNGDLYLGELLRNNGTVTARIWVRRGGAWTQLGGDTVTASGTTLTFEVVKSSLKMFLGNGTTKTLVAFGHDTAATPLAAGTVGIYATGNQVTLDDFHAEKIALVDNTLLFAFNEGFPVVTANSEQLDRDWVETAGNFKIVAGATVQPNNTASYAIVNGISESDVSVSALVNLPTTGTHTVGLVARHSGGPNGDLYLGELLRSGSSLTARIWVRRAGGWTLLGSGSAASGVGTFKFEVVKSSLKLFLGNTLVAFGHDTAATPLAAGSVGIYATGNQATLDNFNATKVTLPPNSLTFNDIFDPAAATGQLSSNWVETAGNFLVVDGADDKVQSNNTASYAIVNGISELDVTVKADVELPATGTHTVGLVARHAGGANGNLYLGELLRSSGTVTARIWVRRAGAWTLLGSGTSSSGTGELRFEVVKTSLKLFLGNTLVAFGHETGTPLVAGSVGIYATGNQATLNNFNAATLTLTNYTLGNVEDFDPAEADQQLTNDWLETAGNFKVVDAANDKAQAANGAASYALVNGISVANVSVLADVDVTGTGTLAAGLIARHSGGPNGSLYLGELVRTGGATATARIWRRSSGVWTLLASGTTTDFSGALNLKVTGSSLELLLDSVSLATGTDSTPLAAGTVGMYAQGLATLDNFSAS